LHQDRAFPCRSCPLVQMRQDDLPQVLRSSSTQVNQLPQAQVRSLRRHPPQEEDEGMSCNLLRVWRPHAHSLRGCARLTPARSQRHREQKTGVRCRGTRRSHPTVFGQWSEGRFMIYPMSEADAGECPTNSSLCRVFCFGVSLALIKLQKQNHSTVLIN